MAEENKIENPHLSVRPKLILWAVALVLFTAIIFFIIGMNYADDKSTSSTETDTDIISPDASETVTVSTSASDVTANQKTYNNYNFSFKYPSNWTISEKTYSKPGDEILTVTSPNTAEKIADRTTNPFTMEDIVIRFSTMPATTSTSNTISVWVADQFTNSTTAKNKTSESINGTQAYSAEMQADPSYYATLVQADNGLFALDFGADATKKSDLSVGVNQILSTLQFDK